VVINETTRIINHSPNRRDRPWLGNRGLGSTTGRHAPTIRPA
jgi:hypothetical protein